IFAANTGGPTAINVTGNITLAASLPMITSNVTIVGNGFTLDAANMGRAIFVASGSVVVSNLTIANARAQGAAGRRADRGCGAGLGAGSGVFVFTGASVTLSLVQVRNGAALGGAGGSRLFGHAGGGGGGLGGAGGGAAFFGSGGGGGYAGSGGVGGAFGGGG